VVNINHPTGCAIAQPPPLAPVIFIFFKHLVTQSTVTVLSLEAAMTGIGTQYKNTTDAPSAAEYDELRALVPEVLRQRFKNFETKLFIFFKHLVTQSTVTVVLVVLP
jgi:hypothetical protein